MQPDNQFLASKIGLSNGSGISTNHAFPKGSKFLDRIFHQKQITCSCINAMRILTSSLKHRCCAAAYTGSSPGLSAFTRYSSGRPD